MFLKPQINVMANVSVNVKNLIEIYLVFGKENQSFQYFLYLFEKYMYKCR